MVDTNGHVASGHLESFGRTPVSKIIHPRLTEASLDFHRQGYTFSLADPGGGYRPYDMQAGMRAAFDAGQFGIAPYYLNRSSKVRPARPGQSRHGFGLAMDVVTNAPTAKRDSILKAHGIHLWDASDPNHFEPDGLDVLVAPPDSAFAALNQTQITPATPTVQEDDMKVIHLAVTNDGKPNGSFAVVSASKAKIVTPYVATELAEIWGPVVEVTEDAWSSQFAIAAAAPGVIPA